MTATCKVPKKKRMTARKVVAGTAALAAVTGAMTSPAAADVSNWTSVGPYGAGVVPVDPNPGAPGCPHLSSGWKVYNTPANSNEHMRVLICYQAQQGNLAIDVVYLAQFQWGAIDGQGSNGLQDYDYTRFSAGAPAGADVQDVRPVAFLNVDGFKWAFKAMYPRAAAGNATTVVVKADQWDYNHWRYEGSYQSYNVSLK